MLSDINYAGILFYRRFKDDIQILICKSINKQWTFFGGQKITTESTLDTAVRIFNTPTLGLFDVLLNDNDIDILTVLNNSEKVLLNPNYIIYLVDADDVLENGETFNTYLSDIRQSYRQFMSSGLYKNAQVYDKTIVDVAWVSYKFLYCVNNLIQNNDVKENFTRKYVWYNLENGNRTLKKINNSEKIEHILYETAESNVKVINENNFHCESKI